MAGELVGAHVAVEDRTGPDHKGYAKTGWILITLVPVGMRGAGAPARETEADKGDQGGRHVGQVVDGVTEETDRATHECDDEFDASGQGEAKRREDEGPVCGVPMLCIALEGVRRERVEALRRARSGRPSSWPPLRHSAHVGDIREALGPSPGPIEACP